MNRPSVNEDHCSLSEQQQIEVFAEKFEKEWIDGARGDLSRFLRFSPPGLRVSLFRELLLIELVYRRRLGETPTLEEYARQFPHHAAIVADVFEPDRRDRRQKDEIGQDEIGQDEIGQEPSEQGLIAERYQIEEPIGKGAFGVVYRATDLELGRTVALKLRRDVDNDALARSQQWIEEARLAARLEHPAIVSVFDAGTQNDGTSYLVFQYIEGQTLREFVRTEKPQTLVLTQLFAEIADGLAYAHQRGCVHRDLKPENVLINLEGAPKIVDFGLAIHDDERPGQAGEVAGSPIYMAPEQVRGEAHRLDGRCDIWALGVMLYEALTGTTPFRSQDRDELADEILNRNPKPPRQIRPTVPRNAEAVVLRCLSKDPKQRYSTAGDVANAIRKCGEQPDRRKILLAGGVTAISAGLAAAAWYQRPWNFFNSPADSSSNPSATLDLLLWRNDAWISLLETGVSAVRLGEQARLNATLGDASYPYILWIDAAGTVVPVYPFHQGDWNDVSREKVVQSLALPQGEPDSVWTMEGQKEGVETIVLAVRRSPHPAPDSLRSMPKPSSPVTVERLPRPWQFHNGRLQEATRSRDRAIDVSKTTRLNHPVLAWQRTIYERLDNDFDEVVTVVFPVFDQERLANGE